MNGDLKESQARLQIIDVLRALAALMVVVFHNTETAAKLSLTGDAIQFSALSWLWPFTLGAHGVSAFFIISGFVISLSLNKIDSLSQFVAARFFRLYPIFWVAVIFTAAWRVLFGGDTISFLMIMANLTMLPDWFGYLLVDGIYWTLAVELQFYVMMAIVWKLGLIRRLNLICAVWLGFAILIKLLQTAWPNSAPLQALWQGLLLPYAPFFSIGMLAYNLSRNRLNVTSHVLMVSALVLVVASGNALRAVITGTMVAILLAIAHGATNHWKLPKIFVFLGEGSYCLYLFHQALGHHTIVQLHQSILPYPALAALFAIAFCISVGMMMHVLIEKPLARYTARWRKSQSLRST